MALNPAATTESLNNPTQRANELNDPQFENQQGYFPYELSHSEYLSTLFGLGTPCMHLDTAPADRHVVKHNLKAILNRIDGNFLSTINQYIDSFYVPLRSVYPTNYEKLIPNPTKGQDLPNSALPQVPFSALVNDYLYGDYTIEIYNRDSLVMSDTMGFIMSQFGAGEDEDSYIVDQFILGRLTLLATVLSRGQLLDYLGVQFDRQTLTNRSIFQDAIDFYFTKLHDFVLQNKNTFNQYTIYSLPLDLRSDVFVYDTSNLSSYTVDLDASVNQGDIYELSRFRGIIADILERGEMPIFPVTRRADINFRSAVSNLQQQILAIFPFSDKDGNTDYLDNINTASNPFQTRHISIVKPLAYQQIVAQYYSNNAVDNIYNSDLYMQLLRATMFPADESGFSSEPTFLYNGVTTEYDYISAGAVFHSLLAPRIGKYNRQYVWMTLMFLMRRTLRYGDYFATARPNMLAVGDLEINVENGMVSPIDITKNLLMQRYLNAANYIGSGFLPYFASIFGVTPSDTGTFPRFIAHQKIPFQNQITNNTADEQGKQTTNLVGYEDNQAFDVFIDDIGVLISVLSYDCLPVYKSGVDSSYHFADRFDYFNPMLQGIGDMPIYKSEIIGNLALRDDIFGYTMRNKEYKWKTSRAHGAFCNSLSGFLLPFKLSIFADDAGADDLHIDPDFIRDKPEYLDSVVPAMTGISPGEYYHFVVAVNNEVHSARKIQATPPVLF